MDAFLDDTDNLNFHSGLFVAVVVAVFFNQKLTDLGKEENVILLLVLLVEISDLLLYQYTIPTKMKKREIEVIWGWKR